MKRTIGLTALFLGILSVTGCGKEEPVKEVPEATLSAASLVFDRSASQKTGYVQPQGDGLAVETVHSSEGWCSAETDGEGKIVVSVSENETESVRRAVVSVAFSDAAVAEKTIAVAQESGNAKILTTTATDGYAFDSRGGEYRFTVEASAEWAAELVDCEWAGIAVDYDASTVTVTAPANEGDVALTGKVKVMSGDASLEYSFTQETVAGNKYLSLLGEYDIYAENWYAVTRVYNSKGICYAKGFSGTLRELQDSNIEKYTATFTRTATLVEDKYGISYLLKDFLVKGMAVPVNFSKETGDVEIPSLWNVGFGQQDTDVAACFFVGYWINNGYLTYDNNAPGVFAGAVSEDRNTITVTTGLNTEPNPDGGIPEGSGLCILYMDMSLQSPVLTPLQYACMPFGKSVELSKIVGPESDVE